MNCYDDYIGVLGCNMPIPESGLYVNSLPGMPLMSIDMIANPEQVNFIGVWNDVRIRAQNRLLSEVTARFAKRYKIKSINHSNNIGRGIDISTTYPAIEGARGIMISQNIDNCCSSSNLQAISIQSLAFYNAGNTRDVTFVIINSETKNDLYEDTKEMRPGWNTIPIEQTFDVDSLYIVFFSADSEVSVSLPITTAVNEAWCRCVQTLCDNECCTGEIKGIEVSDTGEITTGSDTFGLSAIYSLTCSYEPLICENRNAFKTAYWYLLGLELIIERIYSSRINWWKINKTENESLVELFTARADEAIQQAVDGINLDMKDVCLACDNNISIINMMP